MSKPLTLRRFKLQVGPNLFNLTLIFGTLQRFFLRSARRRCRTRRCRTRRWSTFFKKEERAPIPDTPWAQNTLSPLLQTIRRRPKRGGRSHSSYSQSSRSSSRKKTTSLSTLSQEILHRRRVIHSHRQEAQHLPMLSMREGVDLPKTVGHPRSVTLQSGGMDSRKIKDGIRHHSENLFASRVW